MESLTPCQNDALKLLKGSENLFVTGGAGSGKSYLIEHFLRERLAGLSDTKKSSFPVLASTGAAAVLVGGCTFHSFFGLGIMEGGPTETVERALKSKRLVSRIKKLEGAIVDEISMIGGRELRAAEEICRRARDSFAPWGGVRIVAVGDFSQLPPVGRVFSAGSQARKDWAFMDEAWERSAFKPAVLRTIVRTEDEDFLRILNRIRNGQVDQEVNDFLDDRTVGTGSARDSFTGTRLFPHRQTAEQYNLECLDKLKGEARVFATDYSGDSRMLETLKKNAPIPERITLKEGALIMLRQNDPERRWVNGSLAHVEKIPKSGGSLDITLWNGKSVEIEPVTFTLLDADGTRAAGATNFPVSLAYATTIHKAQGTTLDTVLVDLRGAWEHGQAYVALSRVRTPQGLFLEGWNARSVVVDPEVARFQSRMYD